MIGINLIYPAVMMARSMVRPRASKKKNNGLEKVLSWDWSSAPPNVEQTLNFY